MSHVLQFLHVLFMYLFGISLIVYKCNEINFNSICDQSYLSISTADYFWQKQLYKTSYTGISNFYIFMN